MRGARGSAVLPSIDGIRAVAVILVLFAHSTRTTGFPVWIRGLSFGDLGNLGVRLFFVVSGFLITHLLLVEEQRTGGISLRKFYLRRALRIFPAFYCFLLVIAVMSLLSWISVPLADFISAATYTMNFDRTRSWYVGHTWSLAVEEQFYLLWPWIFGVAAVRRRKSIIVAVLAITPLIRVATWAWLPAWQLSIGEVFPTIADALGTGVLLALLREQLHDVPRYMRLIGSEYVLLLVPFVLVLNWLNGVITLGGWLIGETLLNLAIALLLDRLVTHPVGGISRMLNSWAAVLIGQLSYSIYLWQQPFLVRGGANILQRFPLNLVFIGIAAYGSYRLVERPFLRLKDRIGGSHGRKTT